MKGGLPAAVSHQNIFKKTCFLLALRSTKLHKDCNIWKKYDFSLFPRPEEKEKGPGFSRLCMHLITMEFHNLRILSTYLHTFVMPNFDTKHYTVCRFIVAKYICMQELTCKLKLVPIWSETVSSLGVGWKTKASTYRQCNSLGFHWTFICFFCWRFSPINSTRLFAKGTKVRPTQAMYIAT